MPIIKVRKNAVKFNNLKYSAKITNKPNVHDLQFKTVFFNFVQQDHT